MNHVNDKKLSRGDKLAFWILMICLSTALLSDGPRSVGAAICFAAVVRLIVEEDKKDSAKGGS